MSARWVGRWTQLARLGSLLVLLACGVGGLLGGLLTGCSDSAPDARIADPVLIAALADVNLALAEADTSDADVLEAQALALHGLDTAAFRSELRRRADDPDALMAVYDSVAAHLQAVRDTLP